MKFGERVGKVRKSREITQQQVADLMCISLNTYRRLEYGADNPRLSTIEKVMNVFQVSLEELFPELSGKQLSLSIPERELLDSFNSLSIDQQHKLLSFLAALK